MTALRKSEDQIDEAFYLEGEDHAPCRHEYVRGHVHAMAGGTGAHNEVSLSLAAAFRGALRGKSCRAYMADMKLRIGFLDGSVYYYPDVMVACDDPPPDPRFREQPVIVVEVLSSSTERADSHEKLMAYRLIPSLRHYLMVRQDRWQIEHVRRLHGDEWTTSLLREPQDVMDLPEIGLSLTLAEIYADTGVAPPAA